jgi:predicted homoserine dehydrogenase-like protein
VHRLLESTLAERPHPIRVAIVGCGWFGRGIARELVRRSNVQLAGLFVRADLGQAERLLRDLAPLGGPSRASLRPEPGLSPGTCVLGTDLEAIRDLPGLDAVFDASGDLSAGVRAAVAAAEKGAHFVTVGAEMDATVGLSLARLAAEHGVVYTVCDGDQPGVLARMIHEAHFLGFDVKLAGCGKEYLDPYQTPEGARRHCGDTQNPAKVCSFADGSKQSAELVSVANGFGLRPLRRGMHGPRVPKRHIVSTFERLAQLSRQDGGHVDYTLGSVEPGQGAPVFLIASHPQEYGRADMRYLKKGEGPLYLFFRDHHLCYFEAASSVLEAVLFRQPTLAPAGRFADVVAVAKRDLPAGRRLDGIGGFDCYGLVECSETVAAEGLLPLGLAEFATLEDPVRKDEPIPRAAVDVADNELTRLRVRMEKSPIGRPGTCDPRAAHLVAGEGSAAPPHQKSS